MMNQDDCQRALDDGLRLEGNGFRIYMERRALVVQDLMEGWWEAFDTYTLRATTKRPRSRAVSGKREAIARRHRVASCVGDQLDHLTADAAVETGALAAALLVGDNEHPFEASKMIPTVGAMRQRAFPYYYDVPDDGVVAQVALATTVLALLGGQADEEDLLEGFWALGHKAAEAREMLALVCRRGGVRCRDERSPVRTYYLV